MCLHARSVAGERTRSHFFGESIDRYTTIDMYRRPATNYAGRVVMDCGRPGDGYYTQKYPCKYTNVPMYEHRNTYVSTKTFCVVHRTWRLHFQVRVKKRSENTFYFLKVFFLAFSEHHVVRFNRTTESNANLAVGLRKDGGAV